MPGIAVEGQLRGNRCTMGTHATKKLPRGFVCRRGPALRTNGYLFQFGDLCDMLFDTVFMNLSQPAVRMRLLCAALVAALPTSVSCFAVGPRVAPLQPLVAVPAATAPSSVDAVRANSARSKRRRWSATAVGTDADDLGTEILVEIKGGIQVCSCGNDRYNIGRRKGDIEHTFFWA